MTRKENEKKKIEIIRYIMSKKTVAQTASYFGYKGLATVYKVLSVFKAMVTDYAKNHTLEETVSNFEEYRLTEKWLIQNDIECCKFDVEKLLNDYRSGITIKQLETIYKKSETEIRTMLSKTNIPIREDEEKTNFGTGFITAEKNQRILEHKFSIRRNDIIYVKSAKAAWEKDKYPSPNGRPAIVISSDEFNAKLLSVMVVYLSSKAEKHYDGDAILTGNYFYNSYPVHKAQCKNIDTIHINDIDSVAGHLNEDDIETLNTVLLRCLNISSESDGINSEKLCIDLFEKGLTRPEIFDVLSDISDINKSEIQSILDLNGYSGIKSISGNVADVPSIDDIESDYEDEIAYVMHSDEEYTALEKELISVRAERDVYKNLLEKSMKMG